jgi:Protein of unknown function (DUF2937)
MIIRRLALFFAMLFGFATTQLPEFAQQYRQRLGGAIDELAAIVEKFDQESVAQGLSEAGGIARLEANADPLAKERGEDMATTIARLANLRRAEAAFDSRNSFAKWQTLVTTFDPRIAARAYETYQPAVPATYDGLIAGIIGFVIGGALTHLFGLPIKYRHSLFRRRGQKRGAETAGGAAAAYSGTHGGHDV